jgi:hypothetical protein
MVSTLLCKRRILAKNSRIIDMLIGDAVRLVYRSDREPRRSIVLRVGEVGIYAMVNVFAVFQDSTPTTTLVGVGIVE